MCRNPHVHKTFLSVNFHPLHIQQQQQQQQQQQTTTTNNYQ
jgi:hypothetical protein